jgi:gliding motility-associated-like protein/uncharacterized repeat protein (TIGR01451 family)
MKKIFTFCNLILEKRLFGLLFLFLLCSNAFSQSVCRPTSHTDSEGGLLCIGLDVDSPANAYDNDAGLATFATLINAVGVGCFVEETLTFSQTARAGDQVLIYFGTGNGLLDVSLLSNASIQTKLSGTNVGARTSLNNPLLNLNLLNNNMIAVARYTLTGDANQIQIQVGGLLSLLVNLKIYDVRLDFAKPTVTGGLSQTICSGNTANITATPVAGTTLAWYSSATSTTALATGNTFTTPTLTANTTYYIGVTRAGSCEGSDRLPVVINVSNPIAPVINTSGTSLCSAGATQQTTLSVLNPIPGTTYSWFSSSSGGVALASGTTYSPTVPVGTTNFYVEASIGACLSPARTPVAVVSTAIPATPTILTQSVTIQSGQNATLIATTPESGVNLNWYDVPTGGTAVALNSPNFTTPVLTATKTYYVEAQNDSGNCVSTARVPVTVTVIPSALGGCLEANSQQTTVNGLCLLCTSSNPNNSVDGNSATAARLTLPVGLLNGWIQQTLQFNNPGKAGDIVDVELELPGGLADVALLGGVSLATYNGATYNDDRVFINNPLVSLQLLTGDRFRASVAAGANFDRVEIRFGAVVTVLTSLDIYQATYRYKAPTITGNTTICSGQTTTVTAALAVGETVNWYSTATGGSSLAATAAFTTPALTTATTYYVEITRNGCVNNERSAVLVSVNNPAAPSLVAAPTSLCAGQTSTITVQSPVVGTTYNWYDAASAGNLLFTGTSFTTPALATNTSYYVEAVIDDCISAARSEIPLVVTPLPAAPTAPSTTVIIQTGQNVALQVNPVAGINNDWYDVPTGGTAIAVDTDTFTPSPALTANKTYYVEARSNGSNCSSTTRTAINVVVINTVSSCLQPNLQNVTIDPGLLCVSCTSANDLFSVDGNINTATTLSIPVGVVGSFIQQELIFPTPGEAGDIIDVELEIPAGLLDISALSYISLATYNGATYNNDRININNNLLSVQLLSGNRFKASFTTASTFDRIEVRLGGVATLLTSLNIYGASYRFPDAVITGNAAPICSGQQATLTATAPGTQTQTFAWYDTPTGGAIAAVNPTIPLTSTTTYYLEATRAGCVNSVRQLVTVNVNPYSTAADVVITSPIEATCAGEAVIAPTSALVGAGFRYYTDQTKAQEIITGSVIAGVTFTKDPVTDALSLSGLTAAGVPYNYFISVSSPTTCENEINTLQPVNVTIPTQTPLVVTSPLIACGTADLTTAITPFDTTGNTIYTFYDASNNVINPAAATNITTSGVYSIQAQGNGVTCPSVILPVTVTINPLPSLSVIPSISINTGNAVALNATSDGALAWFDPQGNPIAGPPFSTGILNTPGIYTYTVVASNANCSRTGTVSVNVIDPASCQDLKERVYANAQTSGSIVTGTVSDGGNAVDGNPQTFSTITTGVGLLGVGTTWQNLTWSANIVKGTPVTIKLGSEYSAVALGQNLSVIGTKAGVDIGTMQPVSNSLLNLLSGDNAFEFSFVPSDATGPQDYDGIRIQSASILSVAQNTKVFDAYYTRSVPTVTCTPGDIEDIYYGATDLGIGALTATVGVTDPWNVADNDITTFATMYSGAGVLASADLTIAFKTPSIASDTLRIVVSKPAVLLDVNALTGFSIQRYLGNVAVGAPIQNTSSLLNIRLLPGNTMSMVLVNSQPEPYDRVRIRFGGVAGVLEFLRVHTVERVANTEVTGADPNNKVIVCPGADVTLLIPEEDCSKYVWYDAPAGGNVVANGITYTVPSTLASGIYRYYVQPVRYGCESFARGEVIVEVRASGPVNALTNITLNGAATTSICSPTGTVTLATGLTGTPALTSPIYYWYSFDGTTSQLIPGETTAQLVINGLTPGTYTYYVGVSSNEFCETAAADRKQITFTILPPSVATDISVDDTAVCHDVPASLTPTASTLTNPIFTWYLDTNKTQAITNGAVINGVTYTISATGILSATGLTRALSPVTYYVGVSSNTTCENIAGTLQTATIIINDPNTPTATDTTQDFCLIDAPTFASIQVNETNVIWYSAATGGTAFASTAALTSGTYYGAILDPITSCESSVRLQVTISVTDPGTPTTTDTTQDFCLVDAPTFASIQVNEANVVWYSAATGGTAFASTATLTSGTYYGAIVDPVTNCASSTRLTVTISVTDPGTPTTTDTTQDFCLVNAPTFASIQVNEANVIWYNTATGGTAFASTAALTSGTYYGAIVDPVTNCVSNTRLAVTISVTDPGTPTTTDTTQDFCLVSAPTFASIQVNESNVVWYNSATGGTAFASTAALTSGIYYGAVVDPATNCASNTRLAITISVTDPGTPTTIDTTQDFCLVTAPTFASIQVNETNVVWYSVATGGTAFASTAALTSGTYYGAIINLVTNCTSNTRLVVTISVTDPGTPTTTDTTQDFCSVNAPTFASIQVNEPNVVWYNAATGGTAFASTATLTSGTYYGAIVDPVTNCASNTRLAVTISVTDPGTPTTTDSTQDFCLVDAPTFASIQVNEANVIWYNTATGGTAFASTAALTSGTYYGAIVDPVTNCASNTRLAVTISVADPGTPTTTDTTQDFCLVDAPTFASIQVNETNVVWYNAATGGTAFASTAALTSGTYYGAIIDPVTNCASSTRLAITISVTDPGTPTTIDTTQDFCLVNAPTFASIQVNEANVIWYSAATGGTAFASTATLTSGTYYGAIVDPVTNCTSNTRLAITISVTDSGTPTTTDTIQDFCLVNAPTFASIQVNEPNVVWYNAATGGIAFASTAALTSGTYYGAIVDPSGNCESVARLQVTVTIGNPAATPTTADATQNFCSLNSPTVSNIQVNEANVIWYSTPTGGTAIPATTALTTNTYYGAVASTTGCENPVRLAVQVNVNTPGIITTPNTTQTFCLSASPTIANILVNEPNVVWYSSATGGTPLTENTSLIATTYYAAALNNTTNGCINAARLAITIAFENDALVQLTTSDNTPCVFQNVTYSIANGKSDYVWSVSSGTIVSGGGNTDGSATVSWSDVGAGTVTVTYTNNCDETTTKTLNVTVASCSDLTITNTVSNPTPNFGEEIVFTIKVNNVGEGLINNVLVSELIPSGYTLVSSSASSGVYDTATQVWTIPTLPAGTSETLEVRVVVLPSGNYNNVATIEISTPLDVDPTNNSATALVEPICLTVYNEFTPNNDGANDLFRIDCIETHPNNELKVFNRYGALVYSKKNYENDWDGTANVSGVVNRGDMLPTGTYFYVIDTGDGMVKKGWLSIMR